MDHTVRGAGDGDLGPMAIDQTAMTVGVDTRQRREIARRGRLLQYVTMAWNSAECVVALAAGFMVGSIALVGFGFDSAIEVIRQKLVRWSSSG